MGNMMPDKEQFQLGDVRSLDDVIRKPVKWKISPPSVQHAIGQVEPGNILWRLQNQVLCIIFVCPMQS